jgi:hypothetical protein
MYVKAHDNVCLVLYKTKNPEHSEDAGQDLGTALLLSPFFWMKTIKTSQVEAVKRLWVSIFANTWS